MEEEHSDRASQFRADLGNASMTLIDMVDDDWVQMLETYSEHVTLMKREMVQRGLEPNHAVQILTSMTVGLLLDA